MDILFVAVTLIGLFAIAVIVTRAFQEYSIRGRMRREGRFMEWGDVERQLRDGRGVLIFNSATTVAGRVWWSPEKSAEPETPIPFIIATRAFLTTCPWKYQNASQIQSHYPNAIIIESNEEVLGDPEKGR